MSSFKVFLIVVLSVLSIALGGLYFFNEDSHESQWLEVVFGETYLASIDAPNLAREYSEYWDKRPNGIGKLQMNVKILPNVDSSKNSFLIGYKAEIALNSHADRLEEWEYKGEYHRDDNIYSGQYQVRFFISLLDKDGFCLDMIYTDSKETKMFYTKSFLKLIPGGKSQVEQAIIKSKELSPQLAERIKKICVSPVLTKYKQ